MRKQLIELIVEHSSDELTREDLIDISKESEEELINRISQIIEYFRVC
jgi:hypothetical protein